MPLRVFHRWLDSVSLRRKRELGAPIRVETYPPLAWPSRRAWHSRVGDWLTASTWAGSSADVPKRLSRRAPSDVLAATRLEFADALIDVRTRAAGDALDRIAVTRTLHELWHFREEVFSLVARRHDQAEAARRLASLDRHFPKRIRRSGFAPMNASVARRGS